MSIRCASVVNTRFGSRTACSAIHWSFVDTVGELKVSPVFPSSETSCPASPSLPWVPWASVPHVPDFQASLALPPSVLCSAKTAHRPSRVASLFTRSPVPRLFPFLCVPSFLRLADCGETRRQRQGSWSAGTPALPALYARKLWALPSPRATPMSTCPALRPRWCPPHSPSRETELLPSVRSKTSAFLPLGWGSYPS